MPRRTILILTLGLLAANSSPACADESIVAINADPKSVRLAGPQATMTLLVEGKTATGQVVDLTRSARYHVKDAGIAQVGATGVVRGIRDGVTEIVVEANGRRQGVRVEVSDSARTRALHFENDIEPILSRFGCNAAGCHGAAEGQNGFKLSVFGFDPVADHAALTKEGRGRRVVYEAPDASLVLAKASGHIAHGGGVRIPRGTAEYETLRAWVAAGTPMGDPKAPHVVSIRVEPRQRSMAMKGQQQLRVIAHYSDGREADVTVHAKFQANQEALASVAVDGLVSAGEVPGEVAVMASYLGAVDTFRALIPRPGRIEPFPPFPANNFIDGLVLARLKALNIAPSELADDAEFLRRVYLDVIGTLPTPPEARRFLADTRADCRARLVDELLERPEYADTWALDWADVLRVDRQALGHKGAYAFYRWIRDSVAQNKPFDQFARELVTAEGPLDENGPTGFYKVAAKPGEKASTLAQIFLGVRIACAECHHHPFDRWSQTDYYGMQAFFTQLSLKPSARGEALSVAGDPETRHPRTGEIVPPHALGVPPAKASPGDRRGVLAAWMTAPKNPWFARNLANRTWAHLFGRGLIDPVDDIRDTNPPSNPELLDALAKHVTDSRFDVKALIRAIAASRTYQLASKPNATNAKDTSSFSRAYFRRIGAEVMLDMVSQTTGIPERFGGAPPGTRAIQLWDSKVNHYFLKLFGRPQRLSACECERIHEPSVAQVLHLLNAPEIQAKLAHERGRVATLVREKANDRELIEELYLTFYSRLPSDGERGVAMAHLRSDPMQRRQAAEDLAWSLMNTLEFVFNH
jgi:Protein of unknown function (DUF1549)/Protein of unknown function (DUF1553)